MWICLNKAFFSIVEPTAPDYLPRRGEAPHKPGPGLLVRARRKGDIERVFPGANVKTTHERDYRFRAFMPRKVVAEAIANEISGINYGNFKNSVTENDLHDAYADFWQIHFRMQNLAGRKKPRQFGRGAFSEDFLDHEDDFSSSD